MGMDYELSIIVSAIMPLGNTKFGINQAAALQSRYIYA